MLLARFVTHQNFHNSPYNHSALLIFVSFINVTLFPLFANQELIKQLEDAKGNLKNAKNCGEQAVDAIKVACGDASPVQQELAAVHQKYGDLLDQLKDKQAKLEQAVEQGTKIKEKLDDVQAWTADSTPTLEAWEPVSTDPTIAKKQLEQLEVCLSCIALLVLL